jgi:D-sedoheptulose 7-phosphate isomerase
VEDPKEIIAAAVADSARLRENFAAERTRWLLTASEKLAEALSRGNKILIAGNGGSAADSQHFATELVVKLTSESTRPAMAAIALTTDTSLLTAASNDFGFEQVFSRQIEALGREGDIFIGISTSGSSANVIEAFKVAKDNGLTTLGLFGERGCAEDDLCELSLCVPSTSTMRIQEEHIFALHLLAHLTEVLLSNRS